MCVKAFTGMRVQMVACGSTHTLFLCSDDVIFGCGYDADSQLGCSKRLDSPVRLASFNTSKRRVLDMVCSVRASIVIRGGVYVPSLQSLSAQTIRDNKTIFSHLRAASTTNITTLQQVPQTTTTTAEDCNNIISEELYSFIYKQTVHQ